MEPRLIVLAGPVGVGKSTQIKLLASVLKACGFRVKTSYLRLDHLLAYVLIFLLVRITHGRRLLRFSSPLAALRHYNPLLFKKLYGLWKFLLVISTAIKYLFSIYIPYKIGFTVIVEDWLITTICDYLHILRAYNIFYKPNDYAIHYFIKLSKMKLNTYVILLDSDLEKLVENWKNRGSFEKDRRYLADPYNYIGFHREMLPKLIKILNISPILIIRTDNQIPKDTASLILKWIFRRGY